MNLFTEGKRRHTSRFDRLALKRNTDYVLH